MMQSLFSESHSSYDYKTYFDGLDPEKKIYYRNLRDQPHFAYMSWRMCSREESDCYKEQGEAYIVSAIILLEQCLIDNRDRKGDAVIFPILFNIEQGIELFLKAYLILISKYVVDYELPKKNHNLKGLISSFEKVMTDLNQDTAATGLCGFINIKIFVDLLFENSDDCTFARFPYDIKDHKHFYVDSRESIIVDMKNLSEWIKSIFYILDRNYIQLKDIFEKQEKGNQLKEL